MQIIISEHWDTKYFNSAIVPKGKCGHEPKHPGRIVGGHDVSPHKHPWMARLSWEQSSTNFCGGTLISRRHILTATHCMIKCKKNCQNTNGTQTCTAHHKCKSRGLEWATLGDHSRAQLDGEIYLKIQRYVIHPKASQPKPPKGAFEYDFSIAVLDECVELNKNIQPACLPTDSMNTYEGQNVTVLGWGHLRYKKYKHVDAGKHSIVLQFIDIKVLSDAKCKSRSSIFNSSFLMCAGDPITWSKDACQDDSGGK